LPHPVSARPPATLVTETNSNGAGGVGTEVKAGNGMHNKATAQQTGREGSRGG